MNDPQVGLPQDLRTASIAALMRVIRANDGDAILERADECLAEVERRAAQIPQSRLEL